MSNVNTIPEHWQKIKGFWDTVVGEWGTLVVLVLVGVGSFGLGRLSALQSTRPPISIVQAPLAASSKGIYAGGEFVASKTGTVYYFPWCAGGENIPAEKLIWFKTKAAAEQAGYSPAKNCKGLGSN